MTKFLSTAILFALGFTFASQATANGQWWPSKWGTDDEMGAFNQLSPELTLKAAKLIKNLENLSPGHRNQEHHAGLPTMHVQRANLAT